MYIWKKCIFVNYTSIKREKGRGQLKLRIYKRIWRNLGKKIGSKWKSKKIDKLREKRKNWKGESKPWGLETSELSLGCWSWKVTDERMEECKMCALGWWIHPLCCIQEVNVFIIFFNLDMFIWIWLFVKFETIFKYTDKKLLYLI